MLVQIIDDNDDIRDLIRQILSIYSIDSVEASGGSQALAWLASTPAPPDVILLDVQMPDMDGWETLEAIRSGHGEIPVVMCTVKSAPLDLERGWLLGCDGYITKPFDVMSLVDVVRSSATRSPQERDEVRSEGLEAARRLLTG